MMSMARTGPYIPFLRPGFWLRTLRDLLIPSSHPAVSPSSSSHPRHPPRPPHPILEPRRHIFRARRQSCDHRGSLASPGLVSLICISRLMHPSSGTQRSCSRLSLRPPFGSRWGLQPGL